MPLHDNLTDSQKMIVITNTLLEQQQKLDKHHKLLIEGNGEPPLMYRIRDIETFVNGIRFWQRTLAVALVLQTVTFIVSALAFFARIYPLLEQIANQP